MANYTSSYTGIQIDAATAKTNALSQATNVLYVDNKRTDSYTEVGTYTLPYKTIMGAMNAITGNSSSNRFCIKIATGAYYTENITIDKDFVTLEGYGETLLSGTITLTAPHFRLKNLKTTGVVTGTYTSAFLAEISDCSVSTGKWTVSCSVTGAYVQISGGTTLWTSDVDLSGVTGVVSCQSGYFEGTHTFTNCYMEIIGFENYNGVINLETGTEIHIGASLCIGTTVNLKTGATAYIDATSASGITLNNTGGTLVLTTESNNINYDNTTSGMTASNVKTAIDELKADTTSGIPGVYLATSYGVTADGSTDDTLALQAAIDAMEAANGGTLYLPLGTIKITSTITVNGSNIVIIGRGMSPNYDSLSMGIFTRLSWSGTAAGTMLEIAPIDDASHGYTHGCKVKDLEFYGNSSNTAGNGLVIRSHRWGEFKNLSFRRFSSNGLAVTTLQDAVLGEARDSQQNIFENILIRQYETTGHGISINGALGANASFNTFRNITCLYMNGHGINLLDSDNNLFYCVQMYRGSGGTGAGVVFQGNSTSASYVSRYNSFVSLSPGAGGVIAKGTTSYTYPSANNRIIFYDKDNSAPDPTTETGATLTWSVTS
jgi:hypothetical protein